MQRDNTIFDLIAQEKWRQTKGLELIASENYVSDQVLEAMGLGAHEQVRRRAAGQALLWWLRIRGPGGEPRHRACEELFGAVWANVQPHSGAQANAAVMLGCLKPG
jgi:glycine hydroxymethyltransferase